MLSYLWNIIFFVVVYLSKVDQVENRQVDSPRNISICPDLIYIKESIASGPCISC